MAIIACKRCKLKKLRCDEEPKICRNCHKAGSACVSIDARSRREFARGYINDLQTRIQQLNDALQAKPAASKGSVTSGPAVSPVAQSTYHGEGSSISMARLIEATVAVEAPGAPFTDIGLQVANLQEQSSRVDVTPAALPPRETAQQLVDSYFNGTHLLHPFLRRSSLLSELESAYSLNEMIQGPALCRLFMVFAIGAVPIYRAGRHSVPAMNYYAAAMEHAPAALGLGGGMEHIQAHMLVVVFSLQHDIGVGNKWDLGRIAMRMCIENNYHSKSSRSSDPMTDQMQRRVFWACYISDRHSSCVLGRPVAMRDEDIDVELPIDADDDLVESGRTERQLLRGTSEVSAQLSQIRMRQITSSIRDKLYRKPATHDLDALQSAVNETVGELELWRNSFSILSHPRTPYETTQWRDLNYNRERLKCFRPLVPLSKGDGRRTALHACQESARQVAVLYGAIRASERLVLNWTCVHDMMSAGFTTLYCALARADAARKQETDPQEWDEMLSNLQDTTACIIDTLSYIAEKWPTVGKHVSVFKALASRVADSMRVTTPPNQATDVIVPMEVESFPLTDDPDTMSWGPELGHQADVWDAAMVAFLNEPLDLANIDWGAVDWDAMGLFHGEN